MRDYDYVENKIKQALKLTRGHAGKARQQVIAWTYEDNKLLHALARPHLTGIVAHAIGRVMNQKDEPEPIPEPVIEQDGGEEFGMEILKSIAGDKSAHFGMESAAPPIKRSSASQRHIDAIQAMISKSKSPSDKS